jgi:hypothetical protein
MVCLSLSANTGGTELFPPSEGRAVASDSTAESDEAVGEITARGTEVAAPAGSGVVGTGPAIMAPLLTTGTTGGVGSTSGRVCVVSVVVGSLALTGSVSPGGATPELLAVVESGGGSPFHSTSISVCCAWTEVIC